LLAGCPVPLVVSPVPELGPFPGLVPVSVRGLDPVLD